MQAGRNDKINQREAHTLFAEPTNGSTNQNREDKPLFLVHNGKIASEYLALLTEELTRTLREFTLYLVKPYRTDFHSLEACAADLLKQIREIQHSGPYYIVGFTSEGSLAYEVAVQIIGEDQKLAFLGIINSSGFDRGGETNKDNPQFGLVSRGRYPATSPPGGPWLSTDVPSSDMGVRHIDKGGVSVTSANESFRRLPLSEEPAMHLYVPIALGAPIHLITCSDRHHIYPWEAANPKGAVHTTIYSQQRVTSSVSEEMHLITNALTVTLAEIFEDAPPLTIDQAEISVQLRQGDRNAEPCICIPGAGASATSLVHLVSSLAGNSAYLGLQPKGLSGNVPPHRSVEAASNAYLKLITTTYTACRVNLIGHSFGGWIAFELASMLRRIGYDVGKLILIDSEPPRRPDEPKPDFNHIEVLLQWIKVVELAVKLSLNITKEELVGKAPKLQRRVLHTALVRVGLMPEHSSPAVLLGALQTFASAIRADYTPTQPYLYSALLIQAEDAELSLEASRFENRRRHSDWQRWIPAITAESAAGDHLSILKPPFVDGLAKSIDCWNGA